MKRSPWPSCRFVTVYKNIGNKIAYYFLRSITSGGIVLEEALNLSSDRILNDDYNASFNDTKKNGASVAPVSRIVSSAMLLLLNVGGGELTCP
jgi:hypothetical protein